MFVSDLNSAVREARSGLGIQFMNGPFEGEVQLPGSKHAFAHAVAVGSVFDGGRIHGVVNTIDTQALLEVLKLMFSRVAVDGGTLEFAQPISAACAILNESLTSHSRNIYCLLPALLHRFDVVILEGEPSGCRLGERPYEWYIRVLNILGVDSHIEDGRMALSWRRRRGGLIEFPFPSMTGTIIAIAASLVSAGPVSIRGASLEPSVTWILSKMSQVSMSGRNLCLVGKLGLRAEIELTLPPDYEYAMTIISALSMAAGEVILRSSQPLNIQYISRAANALGVTLSRADNAVRALWDPRCATSSGRLVAGPFPCISSDWVSCMAVALAWRGRTNVTLMDTMFATRIDVLLALEKEGFPSVSLTKMLRRGRPSALVAFRQTERRIFKGGNFRAADTRSAAAVCLASVAANGHLVSLVDQYHLVRAYEDLPGTLASLGAFVVDRGSEP